MSEIKDRQDAVSDIDPIVAALADDSLAAAAVEGLDEAADPADAEALPGVEVAAASALEADAAQPSRRDMDAGPLAAADTDAVNREPQPMSSPEAVFAAAEPAAQSYADFGDEAPLIASDNIAGAIEAALLEEAPEAVAEPLATSAFEHMPAAYADTIVELDALAGTVDDDAPLLDVDLEDGIASVFAALHAAREDNAPVEPLGDLEAADGVTFRLLGELDRLWHRAA